MLDGIDGQRLLAMVPQERRWMENLKKAFYESDAAYTDGTAPDNSFPAICKAIDVAATLCQSLYNPLEDWKHPSTQNNKRKFISFLHSEIPDINVGGLDLTLIDVRTQQPVRYNFGGLIYAIRCMIHENENLNADENPDYHVTLDWNIPRYGLMGHICDGTVICNANALWWRAREVLAKFILGTEMIMAFERGDGSFYISCDPDLKSIHPSDGRHRTTNAA